MVWDEIIKELVASARQLVDRRDLIDNSEKEEEEEEEVLVDAVAVDVVVLVDETILEAVALFNSLVKEVKVD